MALCPLLALIALSSLIGVAQAVPLEQQKLHRLGAAKPMRCGFVRGWGGTTDLLVPKRSTDPKYAMNSDEATWGQLHTMVKPYCTGLLKFYSTETQKRGWQDQSLQAEYCNFLRDWDIDVVFSHSLGNLIIAGGIRNRLPGCVEIGKGRTARHWYGVSGPLRGTEAANVADKICNIPILNAVLRDRLCKPNGFNVNINIPGIPGIPGIPINNGGINGGGYVPAAAVKSLQTSSVPSDLASIAEVRMSGNLCGVMPANGMVQLYPPPVGPSDNTRILMANAFNIAAATVVTSYPNVKDWRAVFPPGLPVVMPDGNDGVVPFYSCRIAPLASYKKTPSSRWYAMDGSHWDGPCQFGDSKNGLSGFMPCRWIRNMIAFSQVMKSSGTGLILPK